jgi:hypothetical protein
MTVKYIVQKVEVLLDKLPAVHQHLTNEIEVFREFLGQTGNSS